MGIINSIKSGIVGATSDLLSAPARLKALRSKQQADSDVATIKRARSYKNAPGIDAKGNPTDAGMARSLASDVKSRVINTYK